MNILLLIWNYHDLIPRVSQFLYCVIKFDFEVIFNRQVDDSTNMNE